MGVGGRARMCSIKEGDNHTIHCCGHVTRGCRLAKARLKKTPHATVDHVQDGCVLLKPLHAQYTRTYVDQHNVQLGFGCEIGVVMLLG